MESYNMWPFCVWCLSFSVMFLRCIHVIACISISFLFLGWLILYCMSIPSYVYPFIRWWTFESPSRLSSVCASHICKSCIIFGCDDNQFTTSVLWWSWPAHGGHVHHHCFRPHLLGQRSLCQVSGHRKQTITVVKYSFYNYNWWKTLNWIYKLLIQEAVERRNWFNI